MALTVEFGNIIDTPTVFPEEQGKLEITVTNQGDEDVTGATLNLYASTDIVLDDDDLNIIGDTIEGTNVEKLDGTDELLGEISGVNLAAGETSTFTIDFASEDFRTASVVSPGAYNLIAEVDTDNDSQDNDIAVLPVTSDDVVLVWNSVFLNAVQAEGKADLAAGVDLEDNENSIEFIPGVAPPIEARDGAVLHLAIYDAVYALSDDPRSTDIVELPDAPAEASQEAAAVGAAYTVLSAIFPEQQATFEQQRNSSLADINDDPAAEEAGFDFGVEVAQAFLTERSDDRTDRAQVSFEPGTAAGDYQEYVEERQEPDNRVAALLPEWDRVTPFAIDRASTFRPPGQPDFSSPNYAEDLLEVQRLGELTSTERTEDQTEIAQFWSYDRPDTFRPPGQWNQIAQEVSIDQGKTLEDNALLFAELNVAMADAGIVTWDAKYAFDQLRPVTAIRGIVDDNNPNTEPDPDWEPLLPTPNFPDYISGHSAFGGAAAGVLEDFFGEDVSLKIPTQELPGVYREFTSLGSTSSFELAARENAVSREFGGVHVEISNADGVDVGQNVANFVVNESDLFA